MVLHREIVQHLKTGERYILESRISAGHHQYRALGPLHYREHPTDSDMELWLDNQDPEEVESDGQWLAEALGLEVDIQQ